MMLLKHPAGLPALRSVVSNASAFVSFFDRDLSTVSGRDGVSIAADQRVNTDSFVYTDIDAAGSSVHFNNIKIAGALAGRINIVDRASFVSEARRHLTRR